jgi:hypothetical protein
LLCCNFQAVLDERPDIKTNKIVCVECRRKKVKEMRPTRLAGDARFRTS